MKLHRVTLLLAYLCCVFTFTGCQDKPANEGVKIQAPGVDINAGQRGTRIEAPGVKIDAGPGGANIQAPGVDVKTRP